MTINRANYHPDWPSISRQIREQAGWRCEGTPQFPHCRAENGKPHPDTGSRVVLTVAHMDHNSLGIDPCLLRALCQRCHLAWDLEYHMANARRTRARRRRGDMMPLPMEVD